jgi:hypothetical protein
MDTRFWGPDGWRLLHSVARGYPDEPTSQDRRIYAQFFNSLQHILPCIYCRMSMTQYTRELPLTGSYLDGPRQLSLWIYKIHNRVNAKLRGQGLLKDADPPFNEIWERYTNYVADINEKKCGCDLPGLDFIGCVVFNYPEDESGIELVRMVNYVIFFSSLVEVLPFEPYRSAMKAYMNHHSIYKALDSRVSFKKWLFGAEKEISRRAAKECPGYNDICKRIEEHRAGCGSKKDKKPTCRRYRRVSRK